MTDWVVQEDWSKVAIGDQVRVVRGDNVLDGKIVDRYVLGCDEPHAIALLVEGIPSSLHITKLVWTLFVPAKPAVELPTEPGAYLDTKGEAWSLCRAGGWFSHGDGSLTVEYADEEVESVWCRYGPFTKLEPVAVTAKKVLDDVSKFAWADGFMPQLRELSNKYGVTDD
jgi:hypothetical protein